MITSYIPLYYTLNIVRKIHNRVCMETLTLIHIGCAREVFHDNENFFTWDAPF